LAEAVWQVSPAELLSLVVAGVSAVASMVAAYYAWKLYGRRPKLEFYLQEEDPLTYEQDEHTCTQAYLYCWLANEGKTAAHNVHGWLEYKLDHVHPIEDEDAGVIEAIDESANVYLERLMPNPPRGPDTMFIDSPKLFAFPVNVWKVGPVDVKYHFVCDEGATIEGTLRVDFPKVTLP
jgi:hypothetical protein